jgi:hypothetical protein
MDNNKELIGKAFSVVVPPKYTYAVALGALAKYYFGDSTAALVGAAVGYAIGAGSEVKVEDKRAIVEEIFTPRAQGGSASEVMTGTDGGIMSAGQLLRYKYDEVPFTGEWLAFVGRPSVKFHAMIYGRPKQGKSILSVKWAKYLSENFGRVLYVASEEGFSKTLQKKVAEFAMDNNNLDFANFRDFEQIKAAVNAGSYKFVFIDSVNFIKITPEDVEDIKAENPTTAFITIQQATKSGQFRGSQEFAHNCDVVIRVENGIAYQQGRFAEHTEMAIFDGPEKSQKENDAPVLMGAPSAGSGSEAGQLELFTQESMF